MIGVARWRFAALDIVQMKKRGGITRPFVPRRDDAG